MARGARRCSRNEHSAQALCYAKMPKRAMSYGARLGDAADIVGAVSIAAALLAIEYEELMARQRCRRESSYLWRWLFSV